MSLNIKTGGVYEVSKDGSATTIKVYGMWATEMFLRGVAFAFSSVSNPEHEAGLWRDNEQAQDSKGVG